MATSKVQQSMSEGQVQKPPIEEKLAKAISSNSAPSCSKDPSRPRRKKAKRACYACQRAHLTCGMPSCIGTSLYLRIDVNS